jgi:hypothetical protein
VAFFDPEDGGDVPPKRQLKLNGLHGVISQKMILFITTAVQTSNPTGYESVLYLRKKSVRVIMHVYKVRIELGMKQLEQKWD